MTAPLHVLDALVRELGDALPLGRGAALLAAHEDPGLDPRSITDALDDLAASVRIAHETDGIEAIARLHHRLFVELGFTGDEDEYDHPNNSRLDVAIATKRGLPITLSVLYIEVARRKGIVVDPIGFPSHFMVSPRVEPRFFVDVFHGGSILRTEALEAQLEDMGLGADSKRWLAPISSRQVLIRMTQNLFGSHQRRGDRAGVVRALERMAILEPAGSDGHERAVRELARIKRA